MGWWSSQPSSPTKLIRSARTGAGPTWMCRAESHGKRLVRQIGVGERREDVPGARARQDQHAPARRHVLDLDAPIGRGVAAKPVEVVELRDRRAQHQEALRREPGHRHVALDQAARGEKLRERDAPETRKPVRADAVEEGLRARSADLVLREAGELQQARALADGPSLPADGVEPVRPAEARPVLRLHARRGKPVGSLPAVPRPEDRARAPEAVVEGARPRRTTRPPVVLRIDDRVLVLVDVDPPRDRVALRGVGPVAPRVHLPEVDRRLPLDDPLCEILPRPAGLGDPEAQAAGEPDTGRPNAGPRSGFPSGV